MIIMWGDCWIVDWIIGYFLVILMDYFWCWLLIIYLMYNVNILYFFFGMIMIYYNGVLISVVSISLIVIVNMIIEFGFGEKLFVWVKFCVMEGYGFVFMIMLVRGFFFSIMFI